MVRGNARISMQYFKIKAIKQNRPEPVYDIQVKKNNNFFANKLLVHNCIVFQEQIMELCNVVAGFPLADCDKVRRTIMKRSASKAEAQIAEAKALREKFVEGSVKNGVTKRLAGELYDKILFFSGYGFNACLHFDELINTYNKAGKFLETKEIRDIGPGEYVRSRDEETHGEIYTEVVKLHVNGLKPVYEFELETGEKIKCTMDHKFRTADGNMYPMSQILEEELDIVVDVEAHTSL